MKTGWIIAAAVLIPLVLLFFVRVFVSVRFDGDIAVFLRILFIRIKLFPKPNKPKKKKDGKKTKKKDSEKEKSEAVEKKEKTEKKKKQSVSDVLDTVKLIYGEVKKLAGLLFGYLSVRVDKLLISVDAGEASDTALAYAAVTAAVNALFALLDENVDVRYGRDEDIDVIADFSSGGTSADIDISLGFRVWQLLKLGVKAALSYLKIKSKTEDTDK